MAISGPDDLDKTWSKAAPTIIPMTWWRQASYRRSLLSICSMSTQARWRWPVFDAVVSKHSCYTVFSATLFHQLDNCSSLGFTSYRWQFWNTKRLLSGNTWNQNQEPVNANLYSASSQKAPLMSTCSFVVSSVINFPSQWTVRGTTAENSDLSFVAVWTLDFDLARCIEFQLMFRESPSGPRLAAVSLSR